jgi:hypothetical protein
VDFICSLNTDHFATMTILHSSDPALNFHVLLEKNEAGRIIASIAELSNCRVEADSRNEALVAIQELVSDRLSNVEVLPLEVAPARAVEENPWTEFIGMFEGDAEFAEMANQWRLERLQDEDNLA